MKNNNGVGMNKNNDWEWIYINNGKGNTARFVLGEIALGKDRSKNPLICFGVNCSKAEPKKLDPTVKRVQNISKAEGFDGWIMLNLYPERMTKFDKLGKDGKLDLHSQNLVHIKKVFKDYPNATVWVAWGGLIMKRAYLKEYFKDIVDVIGEKNVNWVHRGALVGKIGHPHHPLYLRKDASFSPFDINRYLKIIGGNKC